MCISGGRNNLTLMKKLKFHMIYLNVWRHQSALLPLDQQYAHKCLCYADGVKVRTEPHAHRHDAPAVFGFFQKRMES